MSRQRIPLGLILGAHGVKGLVKLRSFTGSPEDIAAYGRLSDEEGRSYAVRLRGRAKDALLAELSGVSTREAAAALRGTHLYVERAALPAIAEPDTFYHADLLGLAVEDRSGTDLGRVRAVHDFGAGAILEIAAAEGPPLLLPFTRTVVPEVDLSGGRLLVEPPEEPQATAPAPQSRPEGLDKGKATRHKPRLREGSSGDV